MAEFENGGYRLHYIDEGDASAPAVLLVHGFASSLRVNWVDPGWTKALADAGYRAIAFDHRGHGESDKPRTGEAYTPEAMASDVLALADHLGLPRVALFGYSMGARVSAFAGLAHPGRFPLLIFGGLGSGLVNGVGDWDPIAEALLAPSLDDVSHERGRMFRAFADRTRSDRLALAACIETSRKELTADDVSRIRQPVLVGVGTKDDIAGSAERLARSLPAGEAFDIPGRDHMLAVGDRLFKAKVLEFLSDHRALIER